MNLQNLTTETLEAMLAAGREVCDCHEVLAKTGDNIVGELLPKEEVFVEFDHCPPGDIFDPESHGQFYYHAHREGEHGHFHVFMRQKGMPRDCRPVKQSKSDGMEEYGDRICHLIAISMDANGDPIRLFTTNRWITGENWYTAKSVSKMIDDFRIGHAKPSWPVNRWVTSMLRLFRPQIEDLLSERDAVVAKWRKGHPKEDVFEDRELDIPSSLDISIEQQMRVLMASLEGRRQGGLSHAER